MKRIVSGIKPTGTLNIGGYLGAVKNFVKLQDELEDYEFFIFIADLHAITTPIDRLELRKNIRSLAALYLACGLRKERVNLFIQSEIPAHAQLGYVFECTTYIGEMERMTQYKDKSRKQETGISVGLLTYPALMASDILLYDPELVPVGDDQKQHLELTRNIAERFNNKHGETFTVPEPRIAKVGARIMSLTDPTSKMSKSDDNPKSCIMLLDELNIVRKKIKSAVTDSEGRVYYDKENKPGISNLMTIYSLISELSFDEITKKYENKGYAEFKTDLAEVVVGLIEPIQKRYYELLNSKELDEILDNGRDVASKIAYKKINKVYQRIGMGRKRR